MMQKKRRIFVGRLEGTKKPYKPFVPRRFEVQCKVSSYPPTAGVALAPGGIYVASKGGAGANHAMAPLFVLGRVRIHGVTGSEALETTAQMVGAAGGTVFTPNVHHIALARRNSDFASAYSRATLCICDGKPVQWAAFPLGGLPARLPGSWFLPQVLRLAAQNRWRAFFVGGRVGVAHLLPACVASRFPGLEVVGVAPPTKELMAASPDAWRRLEAAIAAARPALILVSLPSPLQEIWADRIFCQQRSGVFVCTGSAVDRLVGLAKDAPPWLGSIGLEWAWRIGQEPMRLAPRYAADAAAFVPTVLAAWGTRLAACVHRG